MRGQQRKKGEVLVVADADCLVGSQPTKAIATTGSAVVGHRTGDVALRTKVSILTDTRTLERLILCAHAQALAAAQKQILKRVIHYCTCARADVCADVCVGWGVGGLARHSTSKEVGPHHRLDL